jgi:glycosyltransferase involved in cell wall biosynthesis
MEGGAMRVCLVGHFGTRIDEGVRNVGREIGTILREYGLDVQMAEITSLRTLLRIRQIKPDILHFVISPTRAGMAIAGVVSMMGLGTRTVISAVHPAIGAGEMILFGRPDLILVQSAKSESLFKDAGLRTFFLPNGVDTEKFSPVSGKSKQALREKYGINYNGFLLLHLASITAERNLKILIELQKRTGYQVLIVGREHESPDPVLLKEVEESGCIVWLKHFEAVEDLYNLSDCYIFPTQDQKACIETPLSVLEAMACNLPVVTTPFQALPDLFTPGDGLFFAGTEDEFIASIEQLQSNNMHVATREKILHLSWKRIGEQLIDVYEDLMREPHV